MTPIHSAPPRPIIERLPGESRASYDHRLRTRQVLQKFGIELQLVGYSAISIGPINTDGDPITDPDDWMTDHFLILIDSIQQLKYLPANRSTFEDLMGRVEAYVQQTLAGGQDTDFADRFTGLIQLVKLTSVRGIEKPHRETLMWRQIEAARYKPDIISPRELFEVILKSPSDDRTAEDEVKFEAARRKMHAHPQNRKNFDIALQRFSANPHEYTEPGELNDPEE